MCLYLRVFVLMGCGCVVFSGVAGAQTSTPAGGNSGAVAAPSAAATPAPAAKKVWTNDDIDGLHGDSSISTFGAKSRKPASGAASAAANAKGKNANYYRDQITKLQAQLPPIDSQIADLQSALAGNPVSAPRKYIGVRPDDWNAELSELQGKRADIVAKISVVEDEARHSGVAPNTLP